jgi:hypothetical protein
MAQKQGSSLVGGPEGEAPWEFLHFDVLGIQFHGSKAGQLPGRGSRVAPWEFLHFDVLGTQFHVSKAGQLPGRESREQSPVGAPAF